MPKKEDSNIEYARHSLAHLLAAAVLELYPETKNTIGPAIENGFYYDFEFQEPISENDLQKIEEKMRELLKGWNSFERKEVTPAEAKRHFAENPYKLELIEEFSKEGKTLSLYTSGGFTDLCRGGHVDDVKKEIKPDAFKLDRIAGAYWRGNEKNKMLTRIYGLAFASKKELDDYLALIEESKKRDHKKLGPELDLFTFSELVGSGLPLWTPKGTLLRNLLDGYVWELRKAVGYEQVDIPHLTKKDLYERSGHWEKFKDELFRVQTREGHLLAIKPMNCPHHTQIYARRPWSYRELPQRYASTTKVYRDEQSGELAGLSRVRAITQDDAHVFCRRSQILEEMGKIWDIIQTFYSSFGFSLEIRLSLSDPEHMEKYLGDQKTWGVAENELRTLVKQRGVETVEAVGEAAFYGPKIDFMGKDSLGREWQVATIQLDMNMPERFDLSCTNEKGVSERIVIIHAAIMGSIERFLSILIEHYAGAFPVWLAPMQVVLIPINEKVSSYALDVKKKLEENDVRVTLFEATETLGKRIREAELQKVPYILVVGEKEVAGGTVNVRTRHAKETETIPLEKFMEKIEKEVKEKK
ncbi:MAG: Threonine-tRNA ligase [Candidatus Jorgensenbacteria bacterium GW2011_GWA2_45_13]|uniref:Threonine--tRNA ligase n=1 Tax=Candidatus Jorgensenbacteria bacterium GW2011_GWA2_45_13 TaxID=1618662 RepID=A0A0G1NCY0_9BACT|nr:MAG: Threonine-tRNA ligase [Candidatus Jorgensenbacteria bacterium GW2011_GWA2_45_13]